MRFRPPFVAVAAILTARRLGPVTIPAAGLTVKSKKVCARIALTCERERPRTGPDEPRRDSAKPQVRRGVAYCPVLSQMAVKALLMRFGITLIPGLNPGASALTCGFALSDLSRLPLDDPARSHLAHFGVSEPPRPPASRASRHRAWAGGQRSWWSGRCCKGRPASVKTPHGSGWSRACWSGRCCPAPQPPAALRRSVDRQRGAIAPPHWSRCPHRSFPAFTPASAGLRILVTFTQ